ncbi:MAG: hypothetical protein B7Y12_02145 [Rhizobiales bacterium 24-66-13]|jgi:hypothetical protein|nr:MAG: hypothetical protein B7Y61_01175 [Rhizobiales bacterium 35-66-30]OYZ82816.1 MAG: hypothetical protein B7Y12_02145 [Rhizobiales bacterium 24-66-13]OZB11849.1 MAG: hypothetical protein B7X67_02125 [Rhizobiales bacterium 39-66-18]HQS08726.1 hypothetical protein [Xanthobacteraceae bacterium]HQS45927.1 hypothetical protein [Xanthobacteraceae bacterium]
MAALTQDRNTPSRSGMRREPPAKAGAKIFAGAMVALDASGWAVPATTATTLKVLGRAERAVDNTAGANGDLTVPVGADIYRFNNSASADAIALTDVGATCYAVDDNTVAKTNGTNTRSAAGTVFDVDSLGVWVKFS